MCLGVPAKILETSDGAAVVELGGVRREISVMLIDDVSVGEWVIVHAGFAIEKLSEEEARADAFAVPGDRGSPMKYIDDFRDPATAKALVERIRRDAGDAPSA